MPCAVRCGAVQCCAVPEHMHHTLGFNDDSSNSHRRRRRWRRFQLQHTHTHVPSYAIIKTPTNDFRAPPCCRCRCRRRYSRNASFVDVGGWHIIYPHSTNPTPHHPIPLAHRYRRHIVCIVHTYSLYGCDVEGAGGCERVASAC